MSAETLADRVRRLEDVLGQAGLNLTIIDRYGVLPYGDEHLDRGVSVVAPSTENTGQYRDIDVARVVDTIQVQSMHRLRPREQRTSRDEALVLEEQIRVVVTSRYTDWAHHWQFVSSQRTTEGPDQSWLSIVQTFSTRRDARLGG